MRLLIGAGTPKGRLTALPHTDEAAVLILLAAAREAIAVLTWHRALIKPAFGNGVLKRNLPVARHFLTIHNPIPGFFRNLQSSPDTDRRYFAALRSLIAAVSA
jgi:hypothetical protein